MIIIYRFEFQHRPTGTLYAKTIRTNDPGHVREVFQKHNFIPVSHYEITQGEGDQK